MPIAISVNMLRLRVTQRLPAALEERPARPQHHRCREGKLDPVRQCRVDQAVTGRRDGRPSPARSTGSVSTRPIQKRRVMSASSGLGGAVEARDLRLQRHAADRADFRGRPGGSPDASGRCRSCLRGRRLSALVLVEIGRGVGGEFGAAAGRAEMIGVAAIVEAVLAGRGIDGHAADGIEHGRRHRDVVAMAG